SSLTRNDIARLHGKVRDEYGRYAANRMLALLRVMFNLARDWGMLKNDNPATRIKMFREEKRDRFLTPGEVQRLNDALIGEPNPYWRAFFPLSLMLGTRRSELLSARWENVDFDARTIRLPETKAGRSHLLPLPAHTIAVLRSLPSRAGSGFL